MEGTDGATQRAVVKTKGTNEELEKIEAFGYDASRLKNTLLTLDQLTVLIFGIVSTSNIDEEELIGRTSIILFCVTSAIVLLSATSYVIHSVYNLKICSRKEERVKLPAGILYTGIAFGAVLYYVGDNLPQASESFGVFGCGETCMENIDVSSRIFLFVALTCLRLLPFLVNKCFNAYNSSKTKKKNETKNKNEMEMDVMGGSEEQPTSHQEMASNEAETSFGVEEVNPGDTAPQSSNNEQTNQEPSASKESTDPPSEKKTQESKDYLPSNFGLLVLGLLVEVDAIYTAVWQEDLIGNDMNGTFTTEECQLGDIAVTSVSIGVVGLAWAVFIPLYCCYNKKTMSCMRNRKNGEGECDTVKMEYLQRCVYRFIFTIAVILIMFYPIPYLLADNTYPLACFPEIESTVRYSLLATTLTLQFVIIVVLSTILKAIENGESVNVQAIINEIPRSLAGLLIPNYSK